MSAIAAGTAAAAPGGSATGRIEVTAMSGGVSIGIPVVAIDGDWRRYYAKLDGTRDD